MLGQNNLHTVCSEASCPNISECWNRKTATVLLLGKTCTRGCRFCGVDTGNPGGVIDPEEIARASRLVGLMGLKYVVLTSVDRDDLPDQGAGHFASAVERLRTDYPQVKIEVLIPDFSGRPELMDLLLKSRPDVIGHNLETVRRLSPLVRDRRADYRLSLSCLEYYKKKNPSAKTKSSLMLGLGETKEEILESMRDLINAGTDILTLGQYLSPSSKHWPVERYYSPDEFEELKCLALNLGFSSVSSGVFVRSSYHADETTEIIKKNGRT
jgi:lipoic acid synthetase